MLMFYGQILAALHFCHQQPERSFHTPWGIFPLCARCTGFHLAVLATIFLTLWAFRFRPSAGLFCCCGLIVLAGGSEVLFEKLGWEGSNAVRCISGVVMGTGVGFLIGAGLTSVASKGNS